MFVDQLKQQVRAHLCQALSSCSNTATASAMLQGMSLVAAQLDGQNGPQLTPAAVLEVVADLAAVQDLPLLLHPIDATPPPPLPEPLPDPQPAPLRAQPVYGIAAEVLPPPSVAIIIAGRNNSLYLAQAIESALNQTIPCEVVYCDDCSDDNSLAIALFFVPRGLRVFPSRSHQGVCATRNRGVRATKAPFLVHLDSDDFLPPDFAERHLEAMRPGVPFVYGPAKGFSETEEPWVWNVPEWDKYDLWRHNTVNTSAMYARWAFEAAGGWQENAAVATMWDFDMSLRAQQFGTPRVSEALLNYRQHAGGFSTSLNERSEEARVPYAEPIRRRNAQVCIFSVVSGRLPSVFPKWLNAVRSTVLFAHLAKPPKLVLMLHDKALDMIDTYQQMLTGCDGMFASVELTGLRWPIPQTPEQARRDNVSSMLATASARIQTQAAADILWSIEDDVIVPRPALRSMFNALTAGSNPPIGVTGCYRNRHTDKLLGGYLQNGEHIELTTLDEYDKPELDFAGTGCFMFWTNRPGSPQVWKSHCGNIAAHDWAWALEKWGTLLMLKDVCCEHHISETSIAKV